MPDRSGRQGALLPCQSHCRFLSCRWCSGRGGSVQEVAHQLRDLFSRRLQEEVASVEEMNLGVVRVLAERAGTVGAENRVALAPHRQHGYAAAAQVLVKRGIHGRIGGVVAEEGELNLGVA